MNKWILLVIIFLLSGCADRDILAPVVGPNWKARYLHASQYIVQRGDTLYSIAFRYDRDYRQLARFNHLYPPYRISIGQVLFLNEQTQVHRLPARQITRIQYPRYRWYRGRWSWPARGRIVSHFAPQNGKKGIDIAGQKGSQIYAAKNGVVAYSGSGLRGYGNLIIIKHDNQFLTAYGNNARNLVRVGQPIKAGQVIAEMGVIEHRFYGVHFEIRQAGRPMNPLSFL